MYRIALDAFALARSQGPLALLRRAGSGTVWRRLVFGGLQIRDWKPALARELLQGDGLEIGALHNPLPVATRRGTLCRSVRIAGLRRHYPELADFELVPVDIIDDGETLVSVPPPARISSSPATSSNIARTPSVPCARISTVSSPAACCSTRFPTSG